MNVLVIQAMNGVRLGVIEQVTLFFCCGWRLLTPEDTVARALAIAFTVSPFLAIRSNPALLKQQSLESELARSRHLAVLKRI
jgi:hypothetical protein